MVTPYCLIALVASGCWVSCPQISFGDLELTRVLVFGLAGCAVALLLEAIMLAKYQGSNNRGGIGAAVFFLFLHIIL